MMREEPGRQGPLEEDRGVLKSGIVTAAWAPVKTKKQYYAVLCERALELHDSEKMYRKRKPAKHLIDLSVSFNVGNDHFDPKMKRCVCLMGPDDTLLLKAENDMQSTEWYDAILSAIIPARALRLGRPVLPMEFFEYCWDVEIVLQPKLKKLARIDEGLPNMCDKTPSLSGPRRLCFYAHTIVLCKRKIEPSNFNVPESGIPPFTCDDFLELQRKFVATFGCQEKYFLMRMGRSSPMGACELWAQCETDEVASDIHDKLNRIIDRETEKRRKMGNGPLVSPSFQLHARLHGHRERSHTQPMRPRTSSSMQGRVGSPASFSGSIGRKPSTGTPIAFGFENPFGVKPPPPSSHQIRIGSVGHMQYNTSANGFPSSRRQSECIREEPVRLIPKPAPTNNIYASMGLGGVMDWKRLQASTSTTHDENEDSGGTIRLDGGSIRDADSLSTHSRRSLAIEATIEPRPSGSSKESESEDGAESIGGSSTTQSQLEEYAPMDTADWMLNGNTTQLFVPSCEKYQLDEVRSYVSDSSDSCYSSMAATNGGGASSQHLPAQAQAPRAYSFGARMAKPSMGIGSSSCTVPGDSGASLEGGAKDTAPRPSGLMPPAEDPRKRAFSLGSKSFFQRPFRKLSQHAANRQARHSQTSASGISLASSSNASSLGPPSSSSTNQISSMSGEATDPNRNRSGSFGSGRSTPFNRRGGSMSAQSSDKGQASRDHLVEIDFGGLGRSGSGSVHSVDSPSSRRETPRSRTSSFGCKNEFTGLTILGDSLEQPTPSDILLSTATQQMIQNSIANSIYKDFQGDFIDEGDYVSTQLVDPALLAQCVAAEEVGSVCSPHMLGLTLSSLSPPDTIRQSQHFETIQETASGKSSRCSSRNSAQAADDDYTIMEVSGIVEDAMTAQLGAEQAAPCPGRHSERATSSQSGHSSRSSRSQSATFKAEDPTAADLNASKNKVLKEPTFVLGNGQKESIQTSEETPSSSTERQETNDARGKPLCEQRVRSAATPMALLGERPPAQIPKRNSVPALVSTDADSSLNYALLQLSTNDKGTTRPTSERARSRSSVVSPALSAAVATHSPAVEYAAGK